jgi:hypothetical protein
MHMHSLARYSKRTAELLRALPDHNYQVSGAFYFLLRVLFNVPSRYSFSIGLETYLELEVNVSQVRTQYPVCTTQELPWVFLESSYGIITLYDPPFQASSDLPAKT